MTASKEERLSALMDGEVSRFEQRRLVDELLNNDEDQARWSRAHLIGDAIRGELPERVSLDLAARISAQIEDEAPLHQSPMAAAPAWIKPASGFAVAATVAVVSILGLQSMVGYEQGPAGAQPLAASAPRPAAPQANFRLASTPAPAAIQEGVSSEEVQRRINRYLVNHSEYATRPGVLPYARIVGYEQAEQ